MTTQSLSGWALGAAPDFALTREITIERIRAAAVTLEGIARRTPVMRCGAIDELVGARVHFKCENFQRIGAFKFRGGYNALARLNDAERARGVLTYSSGNHAQAVALASSILGVKAVIVMPENAPRIKLTATRAHLERGGVAGSRVEFYGLEGPTREEIGGAIAADEGLTIVPPYDHPEVICGQGTTGLELFEEMERDGVSLGALFVCCGGGGLLSGCATVARAMAPGCRVIGVEPEAGDDATRSFAERRLCTVRNPDTIADGARTPYLGRYTLPVILERVDAMRTVSDAELARAMKLVLERMKMVVEPTGVLGLAALLREARESPESVRGKDIGVVISGGNVDVGRISELLAIGES
ncbi:MAG: pyridoxal-phosphate dependent enzyme [Phycisphaerales bacterium JB037]